MKPMQNVNSVRRIAGRAWRAVLLTVLSLPALQGVLAADAGSFVVIARTGQSGLTTIQPNVSINDNGLVAFSGVTAKGKTAFVGGGTGLITVWEPTGFGSLASDRVRINNRNEVLARVTFTWTQEPVIFYVPFLGPHVVSRGYVETMDYLKLFGISGGLDNVVRAWVRREYDFINYPPVKMGTFWSLGPDFCVNNRGQVAFVADQGTEFNPSYVLATREATNSYVTLPVWLGVQPVVADDGTIVFQDGPSPSGSILMLDYLMNTVSVVAGPSMGFTALGRAPGISDDGRFIAFYGDLSAARATNLNTSAGPGIFLSVKQVAGNKIKRLLAITESAGNNQFKGMEPNGHIGVNTLRGNGHVLVVFGAKDAAGSQGLFSLRYDPISDAVIDLQMLARRGDSLGGVGPIEAFSLYDSVNTQGEIAFWVAGSGEAVLKTSTGPGGADLAATIQFDTTGIATLPGNEIGARIELQNLGQNRVQGSVQAEIYLSADDQLDAADLKIDEFVWPVDLDSGGGYGFDQPLHLISGPPPFDQAGRRRLILIVNRQRQLAEVEYGNNVAFSNCFWMGEVLNVLTHGFNPLRLPKQIPIPSQSWEDFLRDLNQAAQHLEELPGTGSLLQNRVKSWVPQWESSEGFWNAFLDLFLAKFSEAHAEADLKRGETLKALAWRAAYDLLMARALANAKNSARHAESAAQDIYQTLESKYLLSEPALSTRFQRIHLIGHSRGAAVNARVSRLLWKAGYSTDQFTALDGFSTDWPGEGGRIGDISIIGEAMARRKLNYRVEQDIARWVLSYITAKDPIAQQFIDLARDVIAQMKGWPRFGAELYPTPEAREVLLRLDLRAPPRKPFGFEDVVIPDLLEPSCHVNIQKLYFSSDQRADSSQQFLLDNFLGKYRDIPVCDPGIFPLFLQHYGSLSQHAGVAAAILQAPGEPAETVSLHQFTDGSFEELGRLANLFEKTVPASTGNEFVDAWVEGWSTPQRILSPYWNTKGSARLVIDNTNASVELRQTAETAIGQVVRLEDGNSKLIFDLAVMAASPSNVLHVRFNSNVVAALPLSTRSNFVTMTVPLAQMSGSGELSFALAGPIDQNELTVARLDNLRIRIEKPPQVRSITLTPAGDLRVLVEAVGGGRFVVETSSDLRTWQETTTIETTNDTFEHRVEPKSPAGRAFYRIKVLPSAETSN